MGLDITWYRGLRPVPGAAVDEDGYPKDIDRHASFHVNPDFPGREKGVTGDTIYYHEQVGGFRAGSYGGYNEWRERLAEVAGYPLTRDPETERSSHSIGAWFSTSGPFWELITFSDCEGVIGSVVAAKVACDFAEFQPRVDRLDDDQFRRKYAEWREAFEAAAQNGAVKFH